MENNRKNWSDKCVFHYKITVLCDYHAKSSVYWEIMKPITRYLKHYYQQTIKQKAVLLDPTYSIVLFWIIMEMPKKRKLDVRKLKSINIIGCKILSSLNVNLMEISTL